MMCYSDIVFDKNLFNISLKKIIFFIFAKKIGCNFEKKNEYFLDIKRDAETLLQKKIYLSIGGIF